MSAVPAIAPGGVGAPADTQANGATGGGANGGGAASALAGEAAMGMFTAMMMTMQQGMQDDGDPFSAVDGSGS